MNPNAFAGHGSALCFLNRLITHAILKSYPEKCLQTANVSNTVYKNDSKHIAYYL